MSVFWFCLDVFSFVFGFTVSVKRNSYKDLKEVSKMWITRERRDITTLVT